jgi:hypothetical protein
MPRIFIQIASYRDPQLVPTVLDCLAQAADPASLHFCIAWQHGPEERVEEFRNHAHVTLIDIPHEESQGACWARNQIQQRYRGEEFTLALDSHHRFVPGWDRKCLEMLRSLQGQGHPKPLLTTYAPPFQPANDPAGRQTYSTKMDFDRFSPEGAILFRASALPETVTGPVPARFASAHFLFTLGAFCNEVPHDPELYFHGEEINLAVRAFTHGYDLFHPHEILCWHEYTREGRQKHWDDHSEWHLRNGSAHARNRVLFGMAEPGDEGVEIDFGRYGLGRQRSLRDYERYAGVHFRRRAVHEHTARHLPLPVPNAEADEVEWERSFCYEFDHTIRLTPPLPDGDGIDFWCVAYDDLDGQPIFRRDLSGDEWKDTVARWRSGQGSDPLPIPNRFYAPRGRPPVKWIVWPHHREEGWREKLEGPVVPA